MWDLYSKFITWYFVSRSSKCDSEVQPGITKTGYFLKDKNFTKTLKRAHAFKIRSTKEELTSQSSRVGARMCEEAGLPFQCGGSQPAFTLRNVHLWIPFFTETSAGINRLWDAWKHLLPAAKARLGGQAAHGKGAITYPDTGMGSVFAPLNSGALHPCSSGTSAVT